MTHLAILPILIPAFTAFLLILLHRFAPDLQRVISISGVLAGLLAAVVGLVGVLDGDLFVYALGDWPAPFGIVLVLDRLSALLVLLTSLTAVAALFGALGGWDRRGHLFHALFHLQLMGLNGAFVTGDIFNLFVFFEILLLASYGLLLHGGGPARARAGIKYVVINLTGSALFLIGVGLLYGVTGTLNMADLAVKIPEVAAEDMGLLRISAFVLLVVFGIKAALLPLLFWLPDAYSSASPPVAALFSVMTKVGAYAILRIYTLAFGAPDAAIGASIADWLMLAALLTLAVGMIGAVASTGLRRLIAYLAIGSVGTMLIAVAGFTVESVAASLYYMTHSILIVALLFLLAEPIARQRGALADGLLPGPALAGWGPLGLLFMGAAVAIPGLPPLSGFLGKALILQSSAASSQSVLIWFVILATSLLAVITLSRAGSMLFWKSDAGGETATTAPRAGELAPICMLTGLIVAMSVLAGPVQEFTPATAADLIDPSRYVETVLSNRTIVDEGT